MIHVDRNQVPAPSELSSKRVAMIMDEARAFYRTPPEERSQQRFDFSKHIGWLRKVVTEPLLELFRGKCAFCESRVGVTGRPDLEQFRSKGGVVGLDGKRSPDHYWWLAFDWENLYPACSACNRTKGNRFPVVGERAPLEAGWEVLREERALLLDPCFDRPEGHLLFSADGTVAAMHSADLPDEERERFGTPTRGQVTIDTFGLNRPALSEARKEAAMGLKARLATSLAGSRLISPAVLAVLAEELHRDAPFLLMKTQLVLSLLDPEDQQFLDWIAKSGGLVAWVEAKQKARGQGADAEAVKQRAFAQQTAREKTLQESSVESEVEKSSYLARAAYIERVEIHGFTSMRDFRFDFAGASSTSGGGAAWLMLLGENGVGKTSVLKAIALALAGRRRLDELEEAGRVRELQDLFRDGGSVRVFLTSQKEPLEVRREGDRLVHGGDASGAKVFLRAFGPSRWFRQPGAADSEDDDFVRIENLFNPFVPLESGQVYLTGLDGERFDEVAIGLKDLLQITETGKLSVVDGEVVVEIPGDGARALKALSSGFEAVLAMSVDLIHMLFARWTSLRDAEGVVLLDEIGAHLHPRWRMRIVDSLRRTFPRVQFVATTHEPLCLRGLRRGEILVLRRQEAADEEPGEARRVVAYRPEEDVSQLRIDQLLTSRMFGLYSTLDPELEAELDRYYELLSRHETALTDDDRGELEDLRRTVGGRGILGSTPRDQLIYRIIDTYLAKEPELPAAKREERRRWTMKQVAEAWSKIPDLADEPPGGEIP